MDNYDLDRARRFFEAKTMFTTGTHELDYLIQRGGGFIVVDVRLPSDYAKGHIPGAVNLPKGKWHTAKGMRKGAVHYLYCYALTCHLAAEAAVELTKAGYEVVEVEGGWSAWEAGGYRTERPTQAA